MTTFTTAPLHTAPLHSEISSRSASAQQPHTDTGRSNGRDSVGSTLSINGLMAALLSVAIILAFVALGGDAAADSPDLPTDPASVLVDGSVGANDSIEVYVVQPGDTLWEIATSIAEPGENVRPTVSYTHLTLPTKA